jgi:hypothetical protein
LLEQAEFAAEACQCELQGSAVEAPVRLLGQRGTGLQQAARRVKAKAAVGLGQAPAPKTSRVI